MPQCKQMQKRRKDKEIETKKRRIKEGRKKGSQEERKKNRLS